jgi:hypothetical protein
MIYFFVDKKRIDKKLILLKKITIILSDFNNFQIYCIIVKSNKYFVTVLFDIRIESHFEVNWKYLISNSKSKYRRHVIYEK